MSTRTGGATALPFLLVLGLLLAACGAVQQGAGAHAGADPADQVTRTDFDALLVFQEDESFVHDVEWQSRLPGQIDSQRRQAAGRSSERR